MGVFVPFWQGGLNLRLVALVVPIQPFAYVVANYSLSHYKKWVDFIKRICYIKENKRE